MGTTGDLCGCTHTCVHTLKHTHTLTCAALEVMCTMAVKL